MTHFNLIHMPLPPLTLTFHLVQRKEKEKLTICNPYLITPAKVVSSTLFICNFKATSSSGLGLGSFLLIPQKTVSILERIGRIAKIMFYLFTDSDQ